jgi:hypothetical protein
MVRPYACSVLIGSTSTLEILIAVAFRLAEGNIGYKMFFCDLPRLV